MWNSGGAASIAISVAIAIGIAIAISVASVEMHSQCRDGADLSALARSMESLPVFSAASDRLVPLPVSREEEMSCPGRSGTFSSDRSPTLDEEEISYPGRRGLSLLVPPLLRLNKRSHVQGEGGLSCGVPPYPQRIIPFLAKDLYRGGPAAPPHNLAAFSRQAKPTRQHDFFSPLLQATERDTSISTLSTTAGNGTRRFNFNVAEVVD
ncbi:hypothetical protein GGR51DRAFT_565887 [Nemania sp. FL0031]|nr:hypothetical protein GGR51DRAFT_565887 [Nemania sp. FL0031]